MWNDGWCSATRSDSAPLHTSGLRADQRLTPCSSGEVRRGQVVGARGYVSMQS